MNTNGIVSLTSGSKLKLGNNAEDHTQTSNSDVIILESNDHLNSQEVYRKFTFDSEE